MTVVVTGSAGQVGSHIVDTLREIGKDVVGIDRRPSSWTDVRADVCDEIPCEGTEIIHCAAQVSVEASVEEPRRDAGDNIDGTLAVLDWARRNDARVIHFSSAAIYGSPEKLPITESHPKHPLSPYGLSKWTSECYALMQGETHGIPVIVLRPFNIFSARSDPHSPYSGVITKFLAQAARGTPPHIHGDGRQSRDFVHISDIVQSVILAMESSKMAGGAFNVGTGHATTIQDLGDLCRHLAKVNKSCTHGQPRLGDIRHSVADISAIQSHGFVPTTNLEENLMPLLSASTGSEGIGASHG